MTDIPDFSRFQTERPALAHLPGAAALSLPVEVRQSSHAWRRVQLRQLAPGGFCIDGPVPLDVTQLLRIRLPGLQVLSARIVDASLASVLCHFVDPLHPAVFDHLVQTLR
ncbi:PilZ domain-containing protein [Novosphingobium sp. FSY-8]|uniref:PilZ domain-containing protein n=1 Tax=Novosphingobium ovatum TaxID=1908523 RepID=A0ABW9XCL4_9SPHN|nr:PilZ domain-containing protein [Novosphingobium ovatum]NBC36258.1 PilZ domain-containing protein [Novosphingobium ovatum]